MNTCCECKKVVDMNYEVTTILADSTLCEIQQQRSLESWKVYIREEIETLIKEDDYVCFNCTLASAFIE